MQNKLQTGWSLANRRALVAGAGRGIGRAIAVSLAQLGARVLVVARGQVELEETFALLDGDGHAVLSADLTIAAGCDRLQRELKSWGYPHVVAANLHGRRRGGGMLRKQLVFGPEIVCENLQYLLQIMPDCVRLQQGDGYGRWIGISSAVAATGGFGQALYAAQKNMLESVFRSLAVEAGRDNITANIVAPGFIDTPGVRENYSEALRRRLSGMNALERSGTAEEVAFAVAFLASPLAAYITGVTLPVNGGSHLNWDIRQAALDLKLNPEEGN